MKISSQIHHFDTTDFFQKVLEVNNILYGQYTLLELAQFNFLEGGSLDTT